MKEFNYIIYVKILVRNQITHLDYTNLFDFIADRVTDKLDHVDVNDDDNKCYDSMKAGVRAR